MNIFKIVNIYKYYNMWISGKKEINDYGWKLVKKNPMILKQADPNLAKKSLFWQLFPEDTTKRE